MGTTAFCEALLQAAPVAAMAVDENLTVKVVSPAAERLLNLGAKKNVGKHVADLLGQGVSAALAETIREGPERRLTWRLPGEGDAGAVTLLAKRLLDREGGVLGAALILEEGPRPEVEKIVRNEKRELVRQMSIGIAHHVRNSLTAIRGFIQIVKEKNGGDAAAGLAGFSAVALKELDRINDVIGGLLQLADTRESRKEAVNLGSLLENVFTFIRGRAALNGIVVTKDFARRMPSPRVDVVMMVNALFSIVDNAIQSMPDGGHLLLRAYHIPAESRVCVEISDSGVGIPPENIKKIFHPFFSTRDEALGFGLALADKIVHDHGGEIRVVSEEGKGSTFTVCLPVETPA
ncbi:MAG: PAS domain-containing protein [Peptococcaceae bacterium]|nr:PAS domain-containing protein [Peptococcaceae bacterium]